MSERQKLQLLRELTGSAGYVSADNLAKNIQASRRTVYAYLDDIEAVAVQEGARLERKTGKGVRLSVTAGQQKRLDKIFSSYAGAEIDPGKRQSQMMKRLLQGEKLSYSKLSEEFYVSRPTLVKDMKQIKADYFQEQIPLVTSNEGTRIQASERDIQGYWRQYLSVEYRKVYGRMPVKISEYMAFAQEELELSDEDKRFILKQVETLSIRFRLAEYYRLHLMEYLAVFIFRLRRSHHHEHFSGYIFERVSTLDTYYIAYELASEIQNLLSIMLHTEDTVFLNDCLIASGVRNDWSSDNYRLYELMANELIQKISRMMNEDLTTDSLLKDGLINHLAPMYFRLKNHLPLQNPYIKEIKKQYSLMFHLTWYVLVELEQRMNLRIPEDEVAFLMIHFQSALERKRDIRKILILTQTGVVTSEILERRIRQFLPSVHVYESLPLSALDEVDLSKVDLIISSEELDLLSPPVHIVSAIPSDAELNELFTRLPAYFEQTDSQAEELAWSNQEHPFIDTLSRRVSIIRGSVHSMEEGVAELIRPLEECMAVYPEYEKSVFEREAMSSTSFETGIAIPHGNPLYVKETHISIYILDRKISWGKERVDVIVLLSISKEDMEHVGLFIERLYEVMQTREKVEKVFKTQSDQEVYRYFARY